jgi:hypothetical protein
MVHRSLLAELPAGNRHHLEFREARMWTSGKARGPYRSTTIDCRSPAVERSFVPASYVAENIDSVPFGMQ